MTDKDITAAALSDPDNPPLTEAELARMRPVARSKRIRRQLGLTQEQFAECFQIPLGTLRDWEQHRTVPDAPAKAYLAAIAGAPDLVLEALQRERAREESARHERAAALGTLQQPR
jgi:putative transcriptional regulator